MHPRQLLGILGCIVVACVALRLHSWNPEQQYGTAQAEVTEVYSCTPSTHTTHFRLPQNRLVAWSDSTTTYTCRVRLAYQDDRGQNHSRPFTTASGYEYVLQVGDRVKILYERARPETIHHDSQLKALAWVALCFVSLFYAFIVLS